jgi:hypothetical protein
MPGFYVYISLCNLLVYLPPCPINHLNETDISLSDSIPAWYSHNL